ncbi:MAG: hypothetical protein ABIW76_13040 [Fibrobacteria bacterium]
MHGFHHERLNLAELLILGSAFLMGTRPRSIFLKIGRLPFLIVTPFILFLLDSYSGFLGYLLFILICGFRFMKWRGRIVLLIMAVIFAKFIPDLVVRFVPLAVQKENQARLESRLEGQNSTSWRYVATEFLIKATVRDPQLFGNGYLSTSTIMNDILGNDSSPHTIASIPYEQGLVGVAIFLGFALCWAFHAGRYVLREPADEMVAKPIYLCIVAMICCATMRILFYYQVRNVDFYTLTTAFLSVAYLGYRNPRGARTEAASRP